LPTEYWGKAFEQIETGVRAIKSSLCAVFEAFGVVNVTHDYNDWDFEFGFNLNCEICTIQ